MKYKTESILQENEEERRYCDVISMQKLEPQETCTWAMNNKTLNEKMT